MFWNQWNTDFYHPNNSRQLPLVWTNDWRPNLIRALWVAVECIRNEWQSVETHRSIFRTHSIITSCAISATHPEFDDTHLHSSEIEAHSLNCGRHGCQSIDLYVCHLQSCMSTSSGVRVSVTVRHIKMQRTYYLDQIVFTDFDNCSMVVFMFYKIIIVPNPSLYHNCAWPCMFSVRVCVSFAYRPMQPMNTCKLVPWLMTCATNRDNFNYIICLNQLCSLEFRTTKYTIHGRTETLAHSLWHRAEYLVWPLCAAHTAYALVHFHCSFYVNIVH